MPNISGSVVFDLNRSATIDAGDTGLANVPVVLRNTLSGLSLTVLTDVNGNYQFTNVPNGNYTITESYGALGGVPTPGNFLTAVVGAIPIGNDPPISFATNPPAGATNLDSLTPNTLIVTVAGADLTNQNFLDGPVIYTSIQSILDPCTTVSNTNLITAADNGTFGVFPAGTAVETGANPDPYPGIASGFSYILPNPPSTRPIDGTYTIQNIMTNMTINNVNTWWRIADHTTGDETGRFQGIGGSNPGSTFFQQTVAVSPNTNYLFSSWILNLIKQTVGFADPALGVEILDQNNNIIYQQTLGNSIPANPVQPEWKEIGTAINSGNNTSLTVKFISQGPAATGNDFAIDDISLRQINVPSFTPVKTISKNYADIGDVVTYTITLTNTCSNPLTNVTFQDTVPQGLSFVAGSVTINGVPNGAVDPNTGFPVPDIAAGNADTITFNATVDSIPTPNNPTNNTATMGYSYSPVTGGIEVSYTVNSNIVPLQVNSAQISIQKSADKTSAKPGDIINYTIVVSNTGNVDADPATIVDPIPIGTTYVNNSLFINGVANSSDPSSGINLAPISPGQTKIVSFSVIVNNDAMLTPITNIATINYAYIVDPNQPKTEVTKNSNQITIELINLIILKVASEDSVKISDTLTYTFTITNNSSLPLTNVNFKDTIPNGASYIANSFTIDGVLVPGANPNTGVNLGTILAGQTVKVSFNVLVNFIPCPGSLVNQAVLTYNYQLTLTSPIQSGTSVSNETVTLIETTNFKQLFVDKNMTIPTNKPDIETVVDVNANIIMSSLDIITTPTGTSNEGQTLTGKKLIIHGDIAVIVQYVALVTDQSVHSAHFNIPFCTFIIINQDIQNLCQIQVTPFVEDIYFNKTSNRKVFTNITFRLETGL